MENNELYDVGEFSMQAVSSKLTIYLYSMELLHFFPSFLSCEKRNNENLKQPTGQTFYFNQIVWQIIPIFFHNC